MWCVHLFPPTLSAPFSPSLSHNLAISIGQCCELYQQPWDNAVHFETKTTNLIAQILYNNFRLKKCQYNTATTKNRYPAVYNTLTL